MATPGTGSERPGRLAPKVRPYAPAVPRRPTDEPPRHPRSPTGAGARQQAPRRPRRPAAAELPPAAANRTAGGLSGLIRGAGSVIGQVSGIDAPARALDRLAASAERAAAFLDHLEADVGIERAVEVLDRLDHLGDVLEDSHRALLEIERMVAEIYEASALAYSSRKRPRARKSSVSTADEDTPSRSAMLR